MASRTKVVLAIETSCDETAVAIFRRDHGGSQLLASEVASQIAEHEKFGGVVPEVASRNHILQLPGVIERALNAARLEIEQVDAFAATAGPGLASSLLIGNSTAKAMAIGAGKAFLAINHLEGHLLSPFFGKERIEPNVALVVSGGHTLLVRVERCSKYEVLGRTVDDAAGEAFDKVAKMLGLGYPGGPEIEREAKNGNAARFDLPRSMLHSGDLNFSFSGLKTAMRYLLEKFGGQPRWERDEKLRRDLAASFQAAVIDVLREKSLAALGATGLRRLTVSGGVSCNVALRHSLKQGCEANGYPILIAEPWLSTDNAAMIAFVAALRLEQGKADSITDEIDPNLPLTNSIAPLGQYSRTNK